MRFSTRAIHAGDELEDRTRTVVVPIYQVSTFKQSQPDTGPGYVYSRTANPTRTALESCFASLEEADHGLAFASGMAAITTLLLSLLNQGDHVLAVEDLYGGTRRLFTRVIYPGFTSHPQHDLARKQMDDFGGMVSFHLKGGLHSWQELWKHLKVFTPAESLGGVESLIEHPSSMTHASVPKEERDRIGVTDSLIRVSVGIEDAEDLIADLSTALEHV